MISTLPNKGTSTVPVKGKMDKSKPPSDHSKEESRSFLGFSRENLSISHSDLEQGFNKNRPRIRRHTIISLIAILLALVCIGLEIWKIQSVVDNSKEIEILKHDIESMKHRLLEQDLLDELRKFEAMYAKEDSEDDDTDDVDSEDYDSDYDDDEEEDDEDSKLSNQEYLGDYYSTPFDSEISGSGDTAGVIRDDDLDNVLAALKMVETKSERENQKKVQFERFLDEEKLPEPEETLCLDGEEEADSTKLSSDDPDSPKTKRKRSVEKEEPVGYNPSGVPIYAHGYLRKNRRNLTRNSSGLRLSLYENLMNGDKVTTEKSKEQPLIHHAIITSWDKHPPKKYYAQSRAATSHVSPPPLYTSRVHNPRQINGRRSGGWRDEGPQALTVQEETVNRREAESLRVAPEPRPLRRRGMTRRHLRGTRQVVAAHYAADSTLFAAEDEHLGNGKGRHYEGVFKAWRANNWMGELGMSRHFTLSTNGQLTVQEPGLYLIYAQIHYVDAHDENGFQVLVNDNSILQCMVYSPGLEHKSRSCFSAQVALLQSGDRVLVKDVTVGRYTLWQQDKSFFGLVRLGDPRPPRQQQQQN